MKIVVTLGGNALLRRGEPMTAQVQQKNVKLACRALKKIAQLHQLVLGHGNGPQVGLIALQNEAYSDNVEPYPFDILGAQSQAMVGYMFMQTMRNELNGQPVVCMLTQSIVSKDDPAFSNPTKFIGPVYSENEAIRLHKEKGWTLKADGPHFRRVVPSPKPHKIVEIDAIRELVENGTMVISGGGGGVPVLEENGILKGIEAVIDKDYCCSLLARELDAEMLVIATDVKGVFINWGEPNQRCIKRASPAHLRQMGFAAGSMGPKIEAACEFVETGKGIAAIGALEDIEDIVNQQKGTIIDTNVQTIEYYEAT